MGNNTWDEIQDAYSIGDRYLLGKKPDKDGKCQPGYKRPSTVRIIDDTVTAETAKYWDQKDAKLRSVCIPDSSTADPNLDWFKREDKRDLDFKLYLGEVDKSLQITGEYYAPQNCKGGWCPADFLPNERAIGTGHMEGYLESSGDCTHQGGLWIDNKANNAHFKAGGVCIFRKGRVPKYVEAANYHTESTCTSAGFSWDDKWLNGISSWSTPCSYKPSAADDATYNGDQSTRNWEGFADKTAGAVNNIPKVLGFWEQIMEWIIDHPYISLTLFIMFIMGPYIAPILSALF
jgi:hypothetical protein